MRSPVFCIVALALVLPSCRDFLIQSEPLSHQTPLNTLQIDSICLVQHQTQEGNSKAGFDTSRITGQATAEFIERWNKAKCLGPVKCIVKSELIVYQKDGSKRVFRICGSSAKETSDWSFDLGDKTFADRLHQNSK